MRSPTAGTNTTAVGRPAAPLRVAFVMEQALGHVAYTKTLQAMYAQQPAIVPTWVLVPYERQGLLGRLPAIGSNWTVRGSLRGAAGLLRNWPPGGMDAALFHTQTVALLSPLLGWRIPVIVSLDATPRNFDSVGRFYAHGAGGSRAESAKRRIHRLVYAHAAALTTWSQWAKDSLVDDYDVDPGKVTVIAPGVDLDVFGAIGAQRAAGADPRTQVLFVGGDFARKGGPELLACMRNGLAAHCQLHVVTRQAVPKTPGVTVYTDLGPNDPRLLALYRSADIFALPTHADCLAVVLGEAMAAGLPIVTTAVGAQAEAVSDGRSGVLVPDGDVDALGAALQRLATDPALRVRMGREGRRIAEQRFDARVNARRLVDVIAEGIDRWQRARCADAHGSRKWAVGGSDHRWSTGAPPHFPLPTAPSRDQGATT